MPLHEDSTSYQYVVCIFYFWFAKVGGGGGGGGGVAKTSLHSFSVRLNGYISTLSVVFQQQQINYGVLNYLPSE